MSDEEESDDGGEEEEAVEAAANDNWNLKKLKENNFKKEKDNIIWKKNK